MRWLRPRVVVVKEPLLNDEDLIKAYSIPAGDLQYRATMQILEDEVQDAHEKAEIASSKSELPHFYNGGAERVGRVRDRIQAIRDEAVRRSKH
jgi:hypothetical protein